MSSFLKDFNKPVVWLTKLFEFGYTSAETKEIYCLKLRKKDRLQLHFSKEGVAIATTKIGKAFVFEDGKVLKLKNTEERAYKPLYWLGDKGAVKLESGCALVDKKGIVDKERYQRIVVNEKVFPDKLILFKKFNTFSLWNGKNYRQSFQCKDGPNSAMHFEVLCDVDLASAVEIDKDNWALIATYSTGKKGILLSKSLKILPLQADALKFDEEENSFVFRSGCSFGRVLIDKGSLMVVDGYKHINADPTMVFKEKDVNHTHLTENKTTEKEREFGEN